MTIDNPVGAILQYIRTQFKEFDAATHVVASGVAGYSGYVDLLLPSIHLCPTARLILPHTAPANAVPLLASIHVGQRSFWQAKSDPNFTRGVHVHLEWLGGYYMLYVEYEGTTTLNRVSLVRDELFDEPILTPEGELTARQIIAAKRGWHVTLSKKERRIVAAMKERLRSKE